MIRTCLGCDKDFEDYGAGNTACRWCRTHPKSCVRCGRVSRRTNDVCERCRSTGRDCRKCGKSFWGIGRTCRACRLRPKPCARCGVTIRRTNRHCGSCQQAVKREGSTSAAQ